MPDLFCLTNFLFANTGKYLFKIIYEFYELFFHLEIYVQNYYCDFKHLTVFFYIFPN